MASPCACGALALLVSGLKASGQAAAPARVRRAVENTAAPIDAGDAASVLTHGRGLMQVRGAAGGGRGRAHRLQLGWACVACPHPNSSGRPRPGVQIDAAWEYLQRSAEADDPADLRYDVRVRRTDSGGAPMRGVYLRDPRDAERPSTFT
jgi:tripeptidyl-peptidase-2